MHAQPVHLLNKLTKPFLGHTKPETTQIYAASTTAMIKESYQKALGRCAGSLSVHRCRRVTVTRYRKGRRYDTMLFTSSTPYNRACWQEGQQP
jgi:hypothetical protein